MIWYKFVCFILFYYYFLGRKFVCFIPLSIIILNEALGVVPMQSVVLVFTVLNQCHWCLFIPTFQFVFIEVDDAQIRILMLVFTVSNKSHSCHFKSSSQLHFVEALDDTHVRWCWFSLSWINAIRCVLFFGEFSFYWII